MPASCTEGDAVVSKPVFAKWEKKDTDWQGEMLLNGLRDKQVE